MCGIDERIETRTVVWYDSRRVEFSISAKRIAAAFVSDVLSLSAEDIQCLNRGCLPVDNSIFNRGSILRQSEKRKRRLVMIFTRNIYRFQSSLYGGIAWITFFFVCDITCQLAANRFSLAVVGPYALNVLWRLRRPIVLSIERKSICFRIVRVRRSTGLHLSQNSPH